VKKSKLFQHTLKKFGINDKELLQGSEVEKLYNDFNECMANASGRDNFKETMTVGVQANQTLMYCSRICFEDFKRKSDNELKGCVRNCFDGFYEDVDAIRSNWLINSGQNVKKIWWQIRDILKRKT
jgi:hypothetical protein